jgi:hypothetical protein
VGSHFLEIALTLRELLRRPVHDPDRKKHSKRILERKIPKKKWEKNM